MENLFIVTDSSQLNKIFDTGSDKLIVLMFYSKNNPDCRKARQFFEKSAMNHITSIFCIIDMEKFEGESRYVNNVNNMPKFDCYYAGNILGSILTANEKDIESGVRSAEQYIMGHNNMKNMAQGNNNNMINPMMGMMTQMPQINHAQVQQQILNYAMMQNPILANQLMQNPAHLQQLVQKQVQLLQQQYMQQSMMQPMAQPMSQPMMQPIPQMSQMNTGTQMPLQSFPTNQNIAFQPAINGASNNNLLPTFEQMQQMFKIFQMMQKMGILNTDNQNTADIQNSMATMMMNKPATPEMENTIVLPSGDKIIPLPNGTYGLVKKK